jgi:serine/threonine protein kinase
MDKYNIIQSLGHGAFGAAYKVLNKNDNQIYVMKKISVEMASREDIEKMENEAKILSSVNSEYVVKYYESFYSDHSFNIVMEFCDGSDLKKYIKEHKSQNKLIEKDKIFGFILDICEGLKEIHSKNLIHRDLKPDNLFLTNDLKVKIGDFGIAKQLNNPDEYAKTCFGSLLYMAPEMAKNYQYNNKIDIWSLGCIIHELCTLDYCFPNQFFIFTGQYKRINQEAYGEDLQNLIDLLLSQDYHQMPSAEEIINFILNKNIPKVNSSNFHRNSQGSFMGGLPHPGMVRHHSLDENLRRFPPNLPPHFPRMFSLEFEFEVEDPIIPPPFPQPGPEGFFPPPMYPPEPVFIPPPLYQPPFSPFVPP